MIDRGQRLIQILELSKESNSLKISESIHELLFDLGIHSVLGNTLNRELRIEIALAAISLGNQIERVIEHLTWKDFEGFVARVLQENDYRFTESFRRRGNNLVEGMEIDVIGVKGKTVLAIDAKMWGVRAGKSSALKEAVNKQAIRTQHLTKELVKLSQKIPSISSGTYTLIPIVVTWLVEDVEIHEGVPVVPIFKLNGFLLEFTRYEDFILSYNGSFDATEYQSKL